MSDFPRLISADDHVVEPPNLWVDRLPAKYRDVGPRVVREKVAQLTGAELNFTAAAADDGEWADVWLYEDKRLPLMLVAASAGFPREELDFRTTTFDEIRPGCWQPQARLEDMDAAGIEASLCFPNIVPARFCGQGFLEAEDKELALLCVKAYNDWMLEEWCADSGGRLIPCAILPLWDVKLATEEALRVGERGCRAVCFSEAPSFLGLPSIHAGAWDPLFAACAEMETVLMLHVGSSSRIPFPSPDAPRVEGPVLLTNNAAAAMVDWLFSGHFETYPSLRVCLAECQVGWVAYYLQHCDEAWSTTALGKTAEKLVRPPSTYFTTNVYVTMFNDMVGLKNVHDVGVDNVLIEVDYPHSATTWPTSQSDLREQVKVVGLDDESVAKIAHLNARRLFNLN